jgi:DNA mismatch repair protein MutS
MNTIKMTPLMAQYHEIKQNYQDTLLFFQVGDFYELFFDDAKKAAEYLGIALTKRGKQDGEPIPLCGVPIHAIDHYLQKLVKGGFCVALCDQLESPRPGSIVKRGVTQVLTPGTLTDTKLLDEKSASYLFSFFECEGKWGLVFSELLTAQLYATMIPAGSYKVLEAEMNRFFPDEVLLSNEKTFSGYQTYFKKQGYFTSCVHKKEGMIEWAIEKFSPENVKHLKEQTALCNSLDVLYGYLKLNNQAALNTFCNIHFYAPDDFLVIDPATQRNLELLKNNQDGGRSNTLLQTIDKAVTAMGSRTLKKWLVRPLLNQKMIQHRLDAVGFLKVNTQLRESLQTSLKQLGDGERIVGRIALQRGQLHDYVHIKNMLTVVPQIQQQLLSGTPGLLQMLGKCIADFSSLRNFLEAALHDDAEQNWKIKKGFNGELDNLRDMVHNSQSAILALEQKEQQLTGINSLKIRFNNVHGYYIEVTNTNIHLVPDRYKRKQTLAGRERYISPELKNLEHDIMSARNEIDSVEQKLFEQVKAELIPFVSGLRKMMHAFAQCDALLSFAQCAYERGYIQPIFTEGRDVTIKEGKHPVVAHKLGSQFISNNTTLNDDTSLFVITGPNMGGKSTYLRQVAQISLLAQCGSFIPARSATLPILDRIFTRIGASDNVAEGKSTFLVEMEETAHICHFATENSLVILDEVGRGTSTFDGVALAQSIIEYLYTTVKARCLFATHYHELTSLQDRFAGIQSFYASSTQTQEGIVFLHKIVPGVSDGSFGLEVAKLAKLPEGIIARATEIEQDLSSGQVVPAQKISSPSSSVTAREREDLSHLKTELEKLQARLLLFDSLNYDELSPKQAFDLLWKFKEL